MRVFKPVTPVQDILRVLSTPEGVKQFKQNKISVVKLPVLKNRVYSEVDYKDTTFACIQVTEDLYVIDCDNLYSFDFIYDLTKLHNCPTLTTRSPYGGHFFFKRNGEPLLHSFIAGGEAAKIAAKKSYGESSITYYTESKILDVEFFTCENKKNGVIFDGYKNGYYEHYGETFDINPMSSNFFSELKELSCDIKNMTFTARAKIRIAPDGKSFYPSKNRAKKIKEWLALGDVPKLEFLTWYDPSGEKNFNFDNLGGDSRNNALYRISNWAGGCGYLTKEEWIEFVWLMYNLYFKDFPSDHPFPASEVKSSILAEGKFESYFREPEETKKLEKTMKTIESLTYAQQIITSDKPFFALNPEQSGANAILFIEKTETQVRVTARNEMSAKTKALSDPFLKEEYITKVKDENGNSVEIFSKKRLCYLNLINSDNIRVSEPYSIYSVSGVSHINLNLSWYDQNPDIPLYTYKTADEIRKEFESTFCYKIISENLLMDSKIRAKFFGDLGTYIKRPQMLNSMLIVRGEGGTGKDKILSNFISVAVYGLASFELPKRDELSDSLVKIHKQRGRAVIATPSLIMGSEFNDLLRNKLVIFSENTKDFKYKPENFLNELKPYISGSDTIIIHPKGKKPEAVFNDKYFIWYTNYDREILKDKADNRRFYFSYSKRNIDIRQKEVRLQLYKELNYDLSKIDFTTEQSEIHSVFKIDEKSILEYLTFVAPYDEDYCGYSILPSNAHEADTFDDEGLEFEDMTDSIDVYTIAKTALRSLLSPEGLLKKKECIRHFEDKTGLYEVAKAFLAIASYQLTGYEKYSNLRDVTDRTYRVSDITKLFMSLKIFDNVIDKQTAKKFFDHELKKLTNVNKEGAVASTSSKIKLRGDIK